MHLREARVPRFHDLTVTDVTHTIRDAVVVTLKPAPEDAAAFAFEPGQYLTFRRDFDGIDLRRSYSICAGLDDGVLQVGIKRVEGGAFSSFANTDLKPGDTLRALPPMGRFTTVFDPDKGRSYLGFVGGSGITPVLSIMKTALAREPKSTFTLVYANRGVNTIMFREQIEDLKNRYLGRLTIIHVLETDTQDIDLFTGRVTPEKCADLFRHWIDVAAMDRVFICGPEPMMLGINAALKDHGVPEDRIKYELFTAGQPGRLARKTAPAPGVAVSRVQVAIKLDGATRVLDGDRDTCVLETGLRNALDMPFACRAGVCSTCRCKVTEGEVEMIANHALEDYEVAQGYVLSCQSYPVTARVTVDYDQ
jgi:ring-1,2-phenylacetyl-CoA epoxidase subunit PaaE